MPTTKQRPKNEGYRLVRPCAKCPFRTDVEPYIRSSRAREIAENLLRGSDFICHETSVEVPDSEDGEHDRGPDSQFCAGALITLEKQGFANQMMRIAERIGIYDASALDMDAPVSDSMDEWVARFFDKAPTVTIDGEEVEYEHCGIVGPDCADPAGYSVGGGAIDNPEPPTCHPVDDTCTECGQPVCVECRGELGSFGLRCIYCSEKEV